MARTVSTTKASTAKSTPPKKGKDAVIQRMNNTIKDLSKFMDRQGIRSIINQGLKSYDKPQGKMYGGSAKDPKKMAKGGKLPMVKKGGKMVPAFAADGKGKMMYGGKTKKKK